jgi:HTH-type transcriptional regulator/antitoxin HigA
MNPVEFIKCTMELHGVGQKELAELLNSRSRASEILNRKRPLSLDQIRKIAAAWDVPAEAMISEYELTA